MLARLIEQVLDARRAPLWRVLLALLLAVVSWLAFDSAPPELIDTGWDKSNHLLAFSTLALVAGLGFVRAPQRDARVLAGLLLYGGFVEFVQSLLPARSAEWRDLMADALGIAIGLVLLRLVIRLGRR